MEKNDIVVPPARGDVENPRDETLDPGHEGVKAVEATHRVFGKYSKWALFIRYVFCPCRVVQLLNDAAVLQFGFGGVHLLARRHDDIHLPCVGRLIIWKPLAYLDYPSRPRNHRWVILVRILSS